jgi:hypothetical protein
MRATAMEYRVPGFRVSLVREPGVKLAEKPEMRTPAGAARIIAEYIGEADRETFVIAMLTVRHRLIGLHTVSVGCLTSSLVHPRLCCAQHNVHYVIALLMWRRGRPAWALRDSATRDAT